MNIKMNPTTKKRWLNALRSGEYLQGKNKLRDVKNYFCCLGVLCNLHAINHPEIAAEENNPDLYLGEIEFPAGQVLDWADLDIKQDHQYKQRTESLAGFNDLGFDFNTIAGIIERDL